MDACCVSDALDKFGLPGAVTGLTRYATSQRIAGRVRTVRLGPAGGGNGSHHLATAAIDAASAGEILVVEQRTGIDGACWGGILTLAAKIRGLAGVIAEGPVRDIDEAIARDFPVFARSLTTHTARGRLIEVEHGGPVTLGDVTVMPGDYVIADGSGVVFVVATEFERVMAAASEISAREQAIMRALVEGVPASQAMDAKYERMLDE